MKKTVLVGMAALMFGAPAPAADVSQALKLVARQAQGALCVVECRILVGGEEIPRSGIGVCIEASGLILTMAIPPQTQVEDIREIVVVPSGPEGKRLRAKLQGLDALSNLAFIRCEDSHPWSAVAFQSAADVSIGDLVVSAGLNVSVPEKSVMLGMGYIANIQKAPNAILRVTGGALSMVGSVVFNAEGRAIGLVTNQPFQPFQIYGGPKGNPQTSLLRNLEQTVSFTPVEEFVELLKSIPSGGTIRRPSWIGGFFVPVPETLREAKGLTEAGLMLDQVLPGSAADKAGLKNRDVVVGINGGPIPTFGNDELTAGAMRQMIARMNPGEVVTLKVQDAAGTRDVKVTVEVMPLTPNEAPKLLQKTLGFALREKVPFDLASEDPNAQRPGLIVLAVAERSPAADADLRQGDLVTAIDGKLVSTVAVAEKLLQARLEGAEEAVVPITVQRGEMTETLTLRASKKK